MAKEKYTDDEKVLIMEETLKPIIEFIERRRESRNEALQTLAVQPLEGMPESIRKMRESEAQVIRAVIQEQQDILAIIRALYPLHKKTTSDQARKRKS